MNNIYIYIYIVYNTQCRYPFYYLGYLFYFLWLVVNVIYTGDIRFQIVNYQEWSRAALKEYNIRNAVSCILTVCNLILYKLNANTWTEEFYGLDPYY